MAKTHLFVNGVVLKQKVGAMVNQLLFVVSNMNSIMNLLQWSISYLMDLLQYCRCMMKKAGKNDQVWFGRFIIMIQVKTKPLII